jgi:hypothetical protein
MTAILCVLSVAMLVGLVCGAEHLARDARKTAATIAAAEAAIAASRRHRGCV